MSQNTSSLTPAQHTILHNACSRERGLVLPVTKLKGGAVKIVMTSLMKRGLVEEVPAGPGEPVWRKGEDGAGLTALASAAAYVALGLKPPAEPAEAEAGAHRRPRRTGTKQALLVDMLRRAEGATVAQVIEATGWQAHTVRGAIAGALKKRLGLVITAQVEEGRGRVYRVEG